MRIYAFKTGPSIHNKLLRTVLDVEFYTFQILFDSDVKILLEDDLDKFQKIHVPVSSIIADAFIRNVSILSSKTGQPFVPGKFASMYSILLDDNIKGYLVKTDNTLFDSNGHDIDTLTNKTLLNKLVGSNREYVNSTRTRVPNCPPTNPIG